MRQFIRHPVEIPLEYELGKIRSANGDHVVNISMGGLAFQSDRKIDRGTEITIRIPLINARRHMKGVVVWSKKSSDHYETGVKFIDPETRFRARMIEQLCHIEQYRRRALRESGRELSGEEAAKEWIERYAGKFPHV